MAERKYKIVMIGAGNVATHLGLALYQKKQVIVQVCSKRKTSSEALAKKLNCKATTSLAKIDTTADVYIIATNDDSIASIADELKLQNKIVVHTSGSIEMGVLKHCSENVGVFYPLQTFSKTRTIDFDKVPVCIEANNKATLETLMMLAKKVSKRVVKIDSEQRKLIHLSAIFANNFTNHLLHIAEELLLTHQLPFDLLQPLITETLNKTEHHSPMDVQTGPAKRGDTKTMKTHLSLLAEHKDYQELYKLLSISIGKAAKRNK